MNITQYKHDAKEKMNITQPKLVQLE